MMLVGAVIIGRSLVHLNVDSQKRIQPNRNVRYPNMRRDNTNSNIMTVIIKSGIIVVFVQFIFYHIVK